eukprot:TRINITY_DN9771_c0_g1_i1.p1 TRINITY_DN9771_c0_g1~~TRINITY_DN9771_c0_g1_i1.p1  ORF type:complete len:105 (-),score=25.02 TRINITY_DN9771_c0_g1_i1:36-350(-)
MKRQPVQSIDEIIERVKHVAEIYQLEELDLFGSFSRNQFKEDSDVDLIVCSPHIKSYSDLFEIQDALEVELGRDVDLFTRDSILANERMRNSLEKDLKMVYPVK